MTALLEFEDVETLDAVFEAVARATGFDPERLRIEKGKGCRDETWARQVAMWAALEANVPAEAVGAFMERNPCSVRSARRHVQFTLGAAGYAREMGDVARTAIGAVVDELGEQAWLRLSGSA